MRKIYIEVEEEYIKGGGVVIGAALSHDDIELHIKFSDAWSGLTKRVIWQNAYGENTVYQNLAGTAAGEHTVLIPFEPKEFAGKVFFGIKGFTTAEREKEGGGTETYEDKAIMSVKTEFIVLPSVSDEDAEAEQAPSASIADQLQADVAALQDDMEETQGDISDLEEDKVDKADGFGLVKHTTSNGVLTTQQKDGDSIEVYTKDKADELLEDKYDMQENGIPKSDLSSEVQASLDKADTAIQDISGKVDKVNGKGLSTNDYTDTDKAKIEYVEWDGEEFTVDGDVGVTNNLNIGTNKSTPANIRFLRDGSPKTMKDYLDEKASATDVAAIEGKIPSQASSSNKLADKDFVNSSIATETAHYISNSGEPFTSVAALEAYAGAVTNNDYAFVTGTDGYGNTYYDRYKASVSESTVTWAKEYRLNNSSFTAEQWAAISSGITAVLVASIADKYEKPSGGIPKTDLASDVQASLDKADTAVQDISGKQDKFQYASTNDVTDPQVGQIIQVQDGSFWQYNGQSWDGLQVDEHTAEITSYDATTSGLSSNNVQGAIDELAAEKQNAQSISSQSAPSAITLADNTVYYLTNVSSLTLTYPQDTHWECLLQVETASSGTVTITFPNTTKYIGDIPTFDNDETWEISIRDGIVVAQKAVSAGA